MELDGIGYVMSADEIGDSDSLKGSHNGVIMPNNGGLSGDLMHNVQSSTAVVNNVSCVPFFLNNGGQCCDAGVLLHWR